MARVSGGRVRPGKEVAPLDGAERVRIVKLGRWGTRMPTEGADRPDGRAADPVTRYRFGVFLSLKRRGRGGDRAAETEPDRARLGCALPPDGPACRWVCRLDRHLCG